MRRIDGYGEKPGSPETFELRQLNFFRNPQTMKNDDGRMMILVTGTQSLKIKPRKMKNSLKCHASLHKILHGECPLQKWFRKL